MKYLVTGGCGFLGSNLAREVQRRGGNLTVADNLSRVGASRNLEWLRQCGDVQFCHLDVRSASDITRIVRDVRPDRVFHLAGQVAMTTSLQDPLHDFEVNVVGGLNVLEAIRRYAPDATVMYSSTNKVYGDLENVAYEEMPTRYVASDFPRGFAESTPLSFCSPYGCSKGTIDQYMLDYARMFGLNTIVFRHSTIFGARQFSTFDQGWIGWFVSQALEARSTPGRDPFTIAGNGKQVRDVLFIDDIVRCYFLAADAVTTTRGLAFNIGGGMENSLSLLELFAILEAEIGVRLRYTTLAPRQSDQKVFVADTSLARSLFKWEPSVTAIEGLRQMITWVRRDEH